MTKKLFVSDFDGTITEKDFFLLYMDKFLGEKGRKYLADYRAENNPSYQFLNNVFAMAKITDDQYQEILAEIIWDSYFPKFLKDLQAMQIDHLILSAGVAFYIKDAIARQGLPEQRVIANSGEFRNGMIRLTHDKSSPIFSELYGIDKGKAIQLLRQEYDYIYFAGDSYPDIPAAEQADMAFAKKALRRHYEQEPSGRVRGFNDFREIADYLKTQG
ncbi:hypothetical protein EII17_07880 [Clostridiales bacterium COT073_COT-073]|nr:hypothetical protein EII17_07880 [Clostridiales bacterium COT073_COT-073]